MHLNQVAEGALAARVAVRQEAVKLDARLLGCHLDEFVEVSSPHGAASVQHLGGHGMQRVWCVFFFNDTATTEIYTLSLHDALPISYNAITRPRMSVRLVSCSVVFAFI